MQSTVLFAQDGFTLWGNALTTALLHRTKTFGLIVLYIVRKLYKMQNTGSI